uniref:NADH-ubiquinone oxidoreductase chain 1 n=1 Tax=Pegea confoederata TaxID=942563 RepID=A0AA86IRA4_9UROC|nr:NADH dehydrogenase subunit 1 [Pegea confoederata]
MFIALTYVGLVLAVAFLVLTERAVLGLTQIRKGPNVVGPWGMMQCVGDGVKLMTKFNIKLTPTSVMIYSFSPVSLVILVMLLISCLPMPSLIISWGSSMLLLFCILGLISLPFMLLGLCYGSTYSTVGSIRVIGLMMSYEILMLVLMMFFKGMDGSWTWDSTINGFVSPGTMASRVVFIMPMVVLWLMELGRTPFDLAEGESELVSGFNVEYGGWGFLLFFFSEMLALLVMSMMFSSLLLLTQSYAMKCFAMVAFVMLSLYIRSLLPRFRLMDVQAFIWFRLTPASLLVGCLGLCLSTLYHA